MSIVHKYIPVTVVVIELEHVHVNRRVNVTDQARAIPVAVEVAGHLGAGNLDHKIRKSHYSTSNVSILIFINDSVLHLRDQSSLSVVGEPRQDFAVASALLILQDDPILPLVEMLQQQLLELLAPSFEYNFDKLMNLFH